MKRFFYRWQYEIFALVGVVVVLWQMLLPGYVLSLDMVFGPSHVFAMPQGYLDTLPLWYGMYALSLIVPAWVVEKLLLVALFFLLFYLPLKFFPEEFGCPQWAKYFAAIFYCVNPFVYERFLAGQWAVLFGYALLAPLLYVLFEFLKTPRTQNALWLAALLVVIGIFSLQVLVMSVLFVALATIITLVTRGKENVKNFVRPFLFLLVIFIVLSSYWLVPLVLSHSSPIATFGSADTQAFTTAPGMYVGATTNVAMLFGFWGESYPWSLSFISPEAVSTFIPASFVLFLLIGIGVIVTLHYQKSRTVSLLIILFAFLALTFSVGVADGPFQGINEWLFAHIYFWKGFRDSEKWSMWLALAYAYFAAVGATRVVLSMTTRIAERFQPLMRTCAVCVFLFIPIMYCAPMIEGFAGQIIPVWYPQSWQQVNDEIKTTPNCRAIFLPWHQYYSLSFDNNLITGNTAASFFDCTIVSSEDAEIGGIVEEGTNTDSYNAIQTAVTNADSTKDAASIDTFKKYGITYVIFTGDLIGADPYTYPFLTDVHLQKVFDNGSGMANIALYHVTGE